MMRMNVLSLIATESPLTLLFIFLSDIMYMIMMYSVLYVYNALKEGAHWFS